MPELRRIDDSQEQESVKNYHYRWLKLHRTFSESPRIRYVKTLKDGLVFISLYLELCLSSLEYVPADEFSACDDGLSFDLYIDRITGDFLRDVAFYVGCTSLDHLVCSKFFDTFQDLGLLTYDAASYRVTITPDEFMVTVGYDAESRDRVRRYRARKKKDSAAVEVAVSSMPSASEVAPAVEPEPVVIDIDAEELPF